MAYINPEKFSELREKAHAGDEKAKKILHAFMHDEDYSNDLEDYFKPVEEIKEEMVVEKPQEEMSKLERFLSDNNVTKDSEDYDEFVEEYYRMFPNERVEKEEKECNCEISIPDLIDDENEAVEGYDKFQLYIVNNPNIDEGKKEIILTKIKKIREEEIEHIKILQELDKEFGNKLNTEVEEL